MFGKVAVEQLLVAVVGTEQFQIRAALLDNAPDRDVAGEGSSMKVLVVVDMQNDFIDGALGTMEARAIVGRVCEKIHNFNGNVVFTQDTHNADYLDTQEGKLLPVEHCISRTDGWKLNPAVDEAIGEAVGNREGDAFIKRTFGSVALGHWLSKRSEEIAIDEVVLQDFGGKRVCDQQCLSWRRFFLDAVPGNHR